MPSPVDLIPVAPEHAEAIQRLVTGSRDIVEQTRLPDPYPEDGAASWIERVRPLHLRGEQYRFAIIGERGEVAGTCALMVSEDRREAELGYWVGAPHRGRGYASAAAREAVRFAFAEAGLVRVFALPLATNVASRRVLKRAGLRFVRLQPAAARWAGREQALYEVKREDWVPEGRRGALGPRRPCGGRPYNVGVVPVAMSSKRARPPHLLTSLPPVMYPRRARYAVGVRVITPTGYA